jgi:hypothetical protein
MVSWWTLFDKGLGTAMDEALYQPRLILVLIALTVVSVAFHELGHASACRRGGGRPGAMGAALYLVWPVFYTDVTDSYRLGRAGRLRVDLGGLYFNGIFTLGTVGVWALVRADALLVMVPIQLLQMVRQLVPLVRFDGYHILADLVGVPDLFARIRPILRSVVPGRGTTAEANPLKSWVRLVVSAWVVVVVPFLVVTLGLVAWTLPKVVASAWGSLGLQAAALRTNLGEGNLDRIALGLVSIVAVALLPASMAYLVGRILRTTTVRVWVATEHRPAPRVVAMLVAVALVSTAGSQWWPEQGTQPIQQASPGPLSDDATRGGVTALAEERSVVALEDPPEPVLVSAPGDARRAAVATSRTGPTLDREQPPIGTRRPDLGLRLNLRYRSRSVPPGRHGPSPLTHHQDRPQAITTPSPSTPPTEPRWSTRRSRCSGSPGDPSTRPTGPTPWPVASTARRWPSPSRP